MTCSGFCLIVLLSIALFINAFHFATIIACNCCQCCCASWIQSSRSGRGLFHRLDQKLWWQQWHFNVSSESTGMEALRDPYSHCLLLCSTALTTLILPQIHPSRVKPWILTSKAGLAKKSLRVQLLIWLSRCGQVEVKTDKQSTPNWQFYIINQYGVVKLLQKRLDLCEQAKEIDRECPIPAGEFTFTKSVDLPNEIRKCASRLTATRNMQDKCILTDTIQSTLDPRNLI